MASEGRWAGRFVAASIIQGGVAFAVMALLLVLSIPEVANPSPGRIVAGGDFCSVRITDATNGTGTATCSNASNWFIVGMIGYALVGVLGIAVSALFYQYLETTLGTPYAGWRNLMAWLHLVLGGGGSSAAALLSAYGGYQGGAALLSGRNPAFVHATILGPLSIPITGLMALGMLGFFLGGIGYVTAWWSARKKAKAAP